MLATQDATTATAARAPFKVDTSRGSHDGTVSHQWMSRPHDQRFLSLDDLYAKMKGRYESSFETRCRSNAMELIAPEIKPGADLHALKVGVTIDAGEVQKVREVSPTHWAFGQMAQLAKSPAAFLRELPSPMVTDILNWRMNYAREVEEVKLYGDSEELWAATGPDYGRIPDYQVVEALREVAGSGRGEKRWKVPGVMNWQDSTYDPEAPVTLDSTTLYASDRDLFCFLVDDRNPIEVGKLNGGEPDLMFRGFYIQNSEVGSRSLKLAGFYLRGVCMNRNLWGVEGFQEIKINHTRLAPSRWLQQAQPALRSYAEGTGQKLLDGVQQAKATILADDEDAALAFLRSRTFATKQAKAILETGLQEEERPVRSAWDFGQAITAYARNIPNADDRIQVELEAKKILDKATGVRPELVAA